MGSCNREPSRLSRGRVNGMSFGDSDEGGKDENLENPKNNIARANYYLYVILMYRKFYLHVEELTETLK
jgi:hypothetical protein